jgi:hypothetical protein
MLDFRNSAISSYPESYPAEAALLRPGIERCILQASPNVSVGPTRIGSDRLKTGGRLRNFRFVRTKTPAAIARDVHAQFVVLRGGQPEVAAHAKRLDTLRFVEWKPTEALNLPTDLSPRELGTRLVDAIFGSSGPEVLRIPPDPVLSVAKPLPAAEASEASWADWDAANR